MNVKSFFVVFVVFFLLFVSGCGGECKKDSDCVKPHFTGKCIDKKCVFTPIPGEIGNGLCEPGENKCNAPVDCGICQGSNGPYLTYECVNGYCVDTVPEDMVEPVFLSSESSTAGIKFKITSDFNQPFNFKNDLFRVEFSLMSVPHSIENIVIKRVELFGTTPDRRRVSLFDDSLSRPLFVTQDVAEDLILDLNTAENNGVLRGLTLVAYFDYVYVSGSQRTLKSGSLQTRFSGLNEFRWVMPDSVYHCPASCDDNNPATEDVCGPETNYFCVHRPIGGQCGNFICEPGENKCSCPVDCGPCEGNAGNYMFFGCVDNECAAQLRPGFSQDLKKVFDDREMPYFHLQNNYEFNDPFVAGRDNFNLMFSLFDKNDEVSQIRITDVRLFEGLSEVAYSGPDAGLSSAGSSAEIRLGIPEISGFEDSKSLVLAVWYEYTRGGQTVKNDFRKPLGKITILQPGV